jgi:hypothetical protein
MCDMMLCKIAFVLDMNEFTSEYWVFLYESYVKCKFAVRKYSDVWVPQQNSIQNLFNKEGTTYMLIDCKQKVNIKY